MKDFERITRLEGQVLSLTNHHNEMANNFKEIAMIQNKTIDQVDKLIAIVARMEMRVNFMWVAFKRGS